MKRRIRSWMILALVAVIALGLASCNRKTGDAPEPTAAPAEATEAPSLNGNAQKPDVPKNLNFVDGIPQLTVYNIASQSFDEMDIEQYVMGVLAGEMRNDWPMEALKAQAVLARTFVLKFIDEKESVYPGADISTDITEAQAYDAEQINDRVEQAVNDTRGQVVSYNGELPYTWFHAHAGGMTELPSLALDYDKEDPGYTQAVSSPDSDKAPTNVKNWTATFPAEDVAAAAKESGADISKLSSISIGEKSESGRAVTLLINGRTVSAPAFRVALDSKTLKSTMISNISYEGGKVTFTGKGYGHGVGMSQWGAYGMADEGSTYEQIIAHYFKDVGVVTMWE